MNKHLAVVLAGVVFGLGLALSKMTHASKVLGFLDITGAWDPSLLLVLGGAVGVTAVAFRFILRRPAPLLADRFHLPVASRIDLPLLAGAAIFGVGWGISGSARALGWRCWRLQSWETWIFVQALFLGAYLHKLTTAVDTTSDIARVET